jgi:hypothetical protein
LIGGLALFSLVIVSCSNKPEFSLQGEKPQQTQSPIPGWPIYKNSTLGYEISYPPDWHLSEGSSTGYPYVTLVDPVAQALPSGSTEVTQGALIEITAEDFRTEAALANYLKHNIRPAYDKDGNLEEVITEEKKSTVWDTDGIYLIQRSGDVLQHNHAALITHPNGKILFQIRLIIPNSTSTLTESYVEIFNRIVETLNFSKGS